MVRRTIRKRSRGFTYLTALFVIAILLGGLALAGETWEISAAREREADLLFVGNQYRRAIGLYYNNTPGALKRYPRALDDLIKDPRQPMAQRYLRRLYADPLGGGEWGVVRADDGGIAGVYSQSDVAPLKVAGFRVRDAAFEGAAKYSDWRFIYAPAGSSKK
jgi:type II secretory pathway pseudopilin PulG